MLNPFVQIFDFVNHAHCPELAELRSAADARVFRQSFLAVYLTFRRSSSFALAYAANDVVLIVLWVLASLADARYVSVVVCFAAFLANDVYGYVNWQRIKIRQKAGNAAPERRPEAQS